MAGGGLSSSPSKPLTLPYKMNTILDTRAKQLVNIDNLISNPSPAGTGNTNPFGPASTTSRPAPTAGSVFSGTSTNPFLNTNTAAPTPSLNQLRESGTGSNGSSPIPPTATNPFFEGCQAAGGALSPVLILKVGDSALVSSAAPERRRRTVLEPKKLRFYCSELEDIIPGGNQIPPSPIVWGYEVELKGVRRSNIVVWQGLERRIGKSPMHCQANAPRAEKRELGQANALTAHNLFDLRTSYTYSRPQSPQKESRYKHVTSRRCAFYQFYLAVCVVQVQFLCEGNKSPTDIPSHLRTSQVIYKSSNSKDIPKESLREGEGMTSLEDNEMTVSGSTRYSLNVGKECVIVGAVVFSVVLNVALIATVGVLGRDKAAHHHSPCQSAACIETAAAVANSLNTSHPACRLVQWLDPLHPIFASRIIGSRPVHCINSRARNKSTLFSNHDDSPSTRRLSENSVGACSQGFKDWSCLASILTHYSSNTFMSSTPLGNEPIHAFTPLVELRGCVSLVQIRHTYEDGVTLLSYGKKLWPKVVRYPILPVAPLLKMREFARYSPFRRPFYLTLHYSNVKYRLISHRDESGGIFPYSQDHDDSPSTRRLSETSVGACSQVFKDCSCLASILTHYSSNADTRGSWNKFTLKSITERKPVCEIDLGRCATSISLRLPCSQIKIHRETKFTLLFVAYPFYFHDFYEYSCGDYKLHHDTEEGSYSYTVWTDLLETYSKRMKNSIESADKSTKYGREVNALFTSCMDLVAINASDSQPVLDLLNNGDALQWPTLVGGGWDSFLIWDRWTDRFEVRDFINSLKTWPHGCLSEIDVARIGCNGVFPSGLNMYRWDYVSTSDYAKKRREQYQSTMIDLVMKLGVPGLNKSDVTRDVRDVFDFEVELAKVRRFIGRGSRKIAREKRGRDVPKEIHCSIKTLANYMSQSLVYNFADHLPEHISGQISAHKNYNDFYEYSCGDYKLHHDTEEGSYSYTVWTDLLETYSKRMKNSIESADKSTKYGREVNALFTSCMDLVAINASDSQPVLDLLNNGDALQWPTLVGGGWDRKNYTLATWLAKLHSLNINSLFTLTKGPNPLKPGDVALKSLSLWLLVNVIRPSAEKDRTRRSLFLSLSLSSSPCLCLPLFVFIYRAPHHMHGGIKFHPFSHYIVFPSGLNMYRWDYVSTSDYAKKRREQYQSTMVDLVMKLGVPGLNKSDVTRDVRDVFDFEVELAKMTPDWRTDIYTAKQLRVRGLYNDRLPLAGFNWDTYVKALYPAGKIPDPLSLVFVEDQTYFQNLSTLIAVTSPRYWKLTGHWTVSTGHTI
eukprot:sb/3461080/